VQFSLTRLVIMKGISSHPLVRIHHENLNSTIKCGWGYRPSGLRAKSSRGEYLLYGDAPVRSLKPGCGGGVYGITVDKKGAMFDASGESDLTEVLQGEIEVGNVTSDIMDKYRALGISKYN